MTQEKKENIPKRKSRAVYVDRRILKSQAFKELKGAATKVLLVFLSKRQVQQFKTAKRAGWVDTNQGEIVFTYREAKERYGIGQDAFDNALTQLMNVGFIDIPEPGIGMARIASKYGISDRWEKYGTPDFVSVRRLSRPILCPKKSVLSTHAHKTQRES